MRTRDRAGKNKGILMSEKEDEVTEALKAREVWLKKMVRNLEDAIDTFITDGNIQSYEISSDAGKNVVKRENLKSIMEARERFQTELDAIRIELYPDIFEKKSAKANTIKVKRW
jgi:hypothetical protein